MHGFDADPCQWIDVIEPLLLPGSITSAIPAIETGQTVNVVFRGFNP
jgi:hypothetical protein